MRSLFLRNSDRVNCGLCVGGEGAELDTVVNDGVVDEFARVFFLEGM